ncbi:hypothetical protein MC885_011968 [Smutsia gigantea]|nr:hypothetical protein MC885_011968 [Smutsia gigantea]
MLQTSVSPKLFFLILETTSEVEGQEKMAHYHNDHKKNDEVEFVRTGYGKDMVKVLHIQRDGKYHSIKEVATSVQLTLSSKKDYMHGDNSDIIPTDTIKNTVHVLAKSKGIKNIETFAVNICEYFLSSFNHVIRAQVYVEEVPWKRFEKNGAKHIHAFIHTPTGTHFCEVEQMRSGKELGLFSVNSCRHGSLGKAMLSEEHCTLGLPVGRLVPCSLQALSDCWSCGPPVIHSGIKDLKVLKTTQSGFEGFLKAPLTTLLEVKDRCFATQVYCKWRYHQHGHVDFEATWDTVRDIILKKFAGPFNKGEYSPSVQKTLYDIQVLSLSQVPEIEDMEISLPNIHYFNIDMSKMGLINKEEVLLPLDNPYGRITGTVKRKLASKL